MFRLVLENYVLSVSRDIFTPLNAFIYLDNFSPLCNFVLDFSNIETNILNYYSYASVLCTIFHLFIIPDL